MSDPVKVLVTGGAGFIGSHFVDRLVKDAYDVTVLDDLSNGKLENIQRHLDSGKVTFIQGDIRDASFVSKALQGVDVVVHFAALTSVPFSMRNPQLTFDVNLFGTFNLLSACAKAGVEKFVFISSCAVFGDPEFLPIKEEHKPNPISPYAESKLIAERYCLGFNERRLLKTVVLRFFNVYGPRQRMNDYSGVITIFLDNIRHNKPLVIYGDGSQTRDFVSVFDVVEAVYASIKSSSADGRVIHVGSGTPTTINELAKTIIELAKSRSEIHYRKERTGDIKYSYADITKATKYLGYKPQFSLRDGLQLLLHETGLMN